MDRAAALTEFDAARDSFVRALATVPDSALRFLKPGDDYALGGLVTHVNAGLQHYIGVLDSILAAGFGACRAAEFPDVAKRAQSGLDAAERAAEMARLSDLHQSLRRRLEGLPKADFERQAPVLYAGASEPHPTSGHDILGWMKGPLRRACAPRRGAPLRVRQGALSLCPRGNGSHT